MGELLGLGDAEVAELVRAENVGEDVVHRLGRDDQGQLVELVVLGHADVVEVLWDRGARNGLVERLPSFEVAAALLVEAAFAGEDAGDLAGAVGAEVEVDADVFIADLADGLACGVDDDEGNEELVGDAVVVVLLDAGDGVGVGAAFGFAVDHGVEGLELALPALVAVHGVVAAVDGGDFADAVLAHLLFELGDVARAGGGAGVAAVHEGVDEDALKAVLAGSAKEGVEVLLVGVDAAVGDEAEEMKLAAAVLGALHGSDDGGVLLEFVFRDELVDAGDVHVDDAAGAEIEVADFAVAHLAVGQADEVLGGADEGVGILAEQLVVGGLAGEGDGVVGGFGAVAPSVEDGEDERTLGHEEDTSGMNVVFHSRINCRGGRACVGTHSGRRQSSQFELTVILGRSASQSKGQLLLLSLSVVVPLKP